MHVVRGRARDDGGARACIYIRSNVMVRDVWLCEVGWSKRAGAQISLIRCHGALDGILRNCGWNRRWWNFEESTSVVMERAMQVIVGVDM